MEPKKAGIAYQSPVPTSHAAVAGSTYVYLWPKVGWVTSCRGLWGTKTRGVKNSTALVHRGRKPILWLATVPGNIPDNDILPQSICARPGLYATNSSKGKHTQMGHSQISQA